MQQNKKQTKANGAKNNTIPSGNNNNNNNNSNRVNPKLSRKPKPRGSSPSENSVSIAYSNKQSFSKKGPRSERFCASEAIGAIAGSVAFSSANKYYLNPGMSATFPWLSVQAQKWQQYRFRYLRFRYETRTSTTSAGSIIMSPDYNSLEAIPLTEAQATNTQDAVENAVWRPEISCTLDPGAMFPVGPRKLIRSQAVAGDLSTYDAGRFFLCTIGMASTAVVGKLWVDYEVELFVPQNTSTIVAGPSTLSQYTIGPVGQVVTTATSTVVIFDSLIHDPLNIGPVSAGLFRPPAGCYHVTGFLTIQSNTATSLQLSAQILKNGASLTSQPIISVALSISSTISPIVQVTLDDTVPINAGDTISVVVNPVGTGVLTILQQGAVLSFTLC